MTTVDDIIASIVEVQPEDAEQHGVKGMKWGVRKDDSTGGRPSRKVARGDKKFDKKETSIHTWIAIHNAAAQKANDVDIPRINSKPAYKNADFTKPSALRTKYYKEHQDAFTQRLEEAANAMTNASGSKQYTILMHDDGSWQVTSKDIKHAADSSFRVDVNYDGSGKILKLDIPEMAQSGMTVDEWLEHYGVKGMRWGVTRSRASIDAAKSDDAKATEAVKAKAKATKVSSLSNKELQTAITRLNLERQFDSLNTSKSATAKARKFVAKLLKNPQNRDKAVGALTSVVGASTAGSIASKADLSDIGK